jgi:hypothetical protein
VGAPPQQGAPQYAQPAPAGYAQPQSADYAQPTEYAPAPAYGAPQSSEYPGFGPGN